MALTTYFNWGSALQADVNLETSVFHESITPEEEVVLAPDSDCNQHLLPDYYYNSHEKYSFIDPNTSYDLDPNTSRNFLHPHHHHLLPCEDHYYYNGLFPCPKRQKYLAYDQSTVMDLIAATNYNMFDGTVVPTTVAEFYDEVAAGGNGGDDGRRKSEKTVSAQSKAARERRRKITEKTRELGRLVPGGSNMNTAHMLHAAAKYLTFLKAQLGMLQLIHTLHEDKSFTATEDLQKLLTSPFVEEKMYLEEKCFVPKEFVATLTNHQDVQSRPSILKDLDKLIGTETDIERKEQL